VLDSINLNAQCAEERTGGVEEIDRPYKKKKKKRHMEQSHSQHRWVFRCLRNTAKESVSLTVCGREFQSLGAELTV